MINKRYLKAHFCPKTNKEEIVNFWQKSWVKPFEKISVWQLFKITNSGLGGACFLTRWSLNIFSGPFCPKVKRKFLIFDWNEYFYSLGRRFCTKFSSNIISGPVLSRTKQIGHFHFFSFLPKSLANSFKMIQYGNYVKSIIL